MNAAQIKDEIRKLNRIDKIGIYRWIDVETGNDLYYRIGMYRSLEIRREIEQKCQVTGTESGANFGHAEQDVVRPSGDRTRAAAYTSPPFDDPQERNDLYCREGSPA
jgi:hypothetical protein